MNKQHYTYQLVGRDSTTGYLTSYIGVRSCNCYPHHDTNYYGSSKHLPHDIKTTHRKSILGVFPTRQEALKNEIYLHELYEVAVNPMFYNKAKQTSTGFDQSGVKASDEIKLLLSKKQKESWTPERRKEYSDRLSGEGNPFYGKTGSDFPLYGCKRTDEHKDIIRATNARTKSKAYQIKSCSTDEILYEFVNMRKFCRDNALCRRSLSKTITGELDNYRGMYAIKLDNNPLPVGSITVPAGTEEK